MEEFDYAFAEGDFEIMQKIIDNYNYDINIKSSVNGATYLIDACKFGEYELAEFLIENGANIHLKDFKGKSAMDYACEKEYYDIISLLSGDFND